MLRQIINQKAREYQQISSTDVGMVEAISTKIKTAPSIVMQILDPVKYADQIAQAQIVEQYQNESDRARALQQAAEAKAAAEAAALLAKQVAEQAAAEAEQHRQENIAQLKDIFALWMSAPVAHDLESWYWFVQNSYGLDQATVSAAVSNQPWFNLK